MGVPTTQELLRKKCGSCDGGVPPLTADEARALLASVPHWALTADGRRLRRTWVARNFQAAIDFFNKVAALAEEEGHHPDLHLEGYRNVAVEVWTHAVGGLTENDFILAAKVSELPLAVKGGGKNATPG
jgi:4a-hydroxytetrahydrobiopterin dehydratase